jgi:hypothetical protein
LKQLTPVRTFHLVLEGTNTEFHYFRALEKTIADTKIALTYERGAGSPGTIANKSVQILEDLRRSSRKESYEARDQVWAVFDRDEHADFAAGVDKCTANGVHLAVSNPCFEIWLIFHLGDFDRPDDRHQVQACLSKLLPEYDPKGAKTANFDKLLLNLKQAEMRAVACRTRRQEEGGAVQRPLTDVDKLTMELRPPPPEPAPADTLDIPPPTEA